MLKLRNVFEVFKIKIKKFPLKISLLYLIISFFWILFSDRVVQKIFTNNEIIMIANTVKGWVYVIIIAVILYGLLNRALNRLEAADKKLLKNYQDLTEAHKELEAVNKELAVSEDKLRQNYTELKTSEDRLMRAQSIAHVGNWELNLSNYTLWASEESFKIYGIKYTSPFLPLKTVQTMVHSEDRSMMDLALKQLISTGTDYNVEFRIMRMSDQQERVLHSIAKLELDLTGLPVKVLGVIRDITEEKVAELNVKQSHEELTALYEELAASDEELKQQFDQIHSLAYNDSITGLPNRLYLQEKVTQIIHSDTDKVVLLFLDLDNFKYINDTFGHFFGDTVLADMGKRLEHMVNENIFVSRLGGDEFAIAVTNVKDVEQINELAQMILFNLASCFKEKDVRIHSSASIGVSIYPDHGNNFEELLKCADTAMYEAKKQGKNRYVIFNQTMNLDLYAKVVMESNLRAAIDNNELVLYYQPVYCLKTDKVHGFEALVRWNSPVYGMVSPAAFIPLAEEKGIITQIGKWVLQTACQFIKRLNSSMDEKLMISVNLSVHQLSQESLVEDVLNVLEENGMASEHLTLEITESILMEDVEKILKKIDTFKSHGIKVALDDFGTGYSSLTYLKRLPISILKLDKAFIDDIVINKTDNDIVESIIRLANTLDLTVIAEGVEEKDQFDCLVRFGCDMIQGYYISKPIPENEVEKVFKL